MALTTVVALDYSMVPRADLHRDLKAALTTELKQNSGVNSPTVVKKAEDFKTPKNFLGVATLPILQYILAKQLKLDKKAQIDTHLPATPLNIDPQNPGKILDNRDFTRNLSAAMSTCPTGQKRGLILALKRPGSETAHFVSCVVLKTNTGLRLDIIESAARRGTEHTAVHNNIQHALKAQGTSHVVNLQIAQRIQRAADCAIHAVANMLKGLHPAAKGRPFSPQNARNGLAAFCKNGTFPAQSLTAGIEAKRVPVRPSLSHRTSPAHPPAAEHKGENTTLIAMLRQHTTKKGIKYSVDLSFPNQSLEKEIIPAQAKNTQRHQFSSGGRIAVQLTNSADIKTALENIAKHYNKTTQLQPLIDYFIRRLNDKREHFGYFDRLASYSKGRMKQDKLAAALNQFMLQCQPKSTKSKARYYTSALKEGNLSKAIAKMHRLSSMH